MEHSYSNEFIERWSRSSGSERANSQPFLVEFIAFLGAQPLPTEVEKRDAYGFERVVRVADVAGKIHDFRIDLYRRGCFVLESKQGFEASAKTPLEEIVASPTRAVKRRGTSPWDRLMVAAFNQAERYARRLPGGEGRPPFVIVADVGYCFDLYAEFTCTGGFYAPFPSPTSNRYFLEDFATEEVRALFRTIWDAPLSLDPGRRSATVTRIIAEYLAILARSLEDAGHDPEAVAAFLMRCLFTMFAEDVGLLPQESFIGILKRTLDAPEGFAPTAEELWRTMNNGGWSVALNTRLLQFNGGLFADSRALPLSRVQIAVLIKAAEADWREVEPAIFGTLLERALDPEERHKLGAHFTPRAYVERLVVPTVITPLREEWRKIQNIAVEATTPEKSIKARELIDKFHKKLTLFKVLDPACGTGNFLYVAFELLKKLEIEVLEEEARYGLTQHRILMELGYIDPHQFLGLEVNPRAAVIADLVLWIGYLQWHYRLSGVAAPSEPVIKPFRNIEYRDAVLAFDDCSFRTDEMGKPIMRWDGRSMILDPVTGRAVPDATRQVPDLVYKNPRQAVWPKASVIVGNPPFLGGKDKRGVLGQGYFEALAKVYPELPESCDFVMYWWHKAAARVRAGKAQRFGFITTNSLSMVFNRRVVERHMGGRPPLSLGFAVQDHPWVDAADGAAVRIAMTMGVKSGRDEEDGELQTVVEERRTGELEYAVETSSRYGKINPDLTLGVNVAGAATLNANLGISSRGVSLHGSGFIVTPEQATELGLGRRSGLQKHIRPYLNGKDLTGKSRGVMVIDLFGLSQKHVLEYFPEVYQWVYERVKPGRDVNNRPSYQVNWWIFGEPRKELRPALAGLPRYIATVETAKHRVFAFLDAAILPDNMLVNIASDDAYILGVLSSRIHAAWALAVGGTLEDRPRYNKSLCFETFPFPPATPGQQERIRELGERLDAHRKERQALHSGLTLTGMYNILAKLRSGAALTAAEQALHGQALGTVLKKFHDELDEAVAGAYGWPVDLLVPVILERLIKLNAERASEEAKGEIRWLRPKYQMANGRKANGNGVKPEEDFDEEDEEDGLVWGGDISNKVHCVVTVLRRINRLATAEEVCTYIAKAKRSQVKRLLDGMASRGSIQKHNEAYFI